MIMIMIIIIIIIMITITNMLFYHYHYHYYSYYHPLRVELLLERPEEAAVLPRQAPLQRVLALLSVCCLSITMFRHVNSIRINDNLSLSLSMYTYMYICI